MTDQTLMFFLALAAGVATSMLVRWYRARTNPKTAEDACPPHSWAFEDKNLRCRKCRTQFPPK